MDFLDFMIKYWAQFAFGLIGTGLGIFCKTMWKNYQRTIDEKHEAIKEEIREEIIEMKNGSDNGDKQLHEELDILKAGILSLQGREFKKRCRELLAEDHYLTLDEYNEIVKEHHVYNGLGGNHNGDILFGLVEQKAAETLKLSVKPEDECEN